MSYRFVKVSNYYPEYLADYYARNPRVSTQTYEKQLDALLKDGFGWSDFYLNGLRKLGVDSHEIVLNALPLEKAWIKENLSQRSELPKFEINDERALLIEHLKALKPDVVMIQDPFRYYGAFIEQLKKEVPSIKKILGWCAVPFNEEHLRQFATFDFMLTCTPEFPPLFAKAGIPMFQVNHGFEKTILSRIEQPPKYDTDFIFLGSLVPGAGMHNFRIQMLGELLEQREIALKVYGTMSYASPIKLPLRQLAYLGAQGIKKAGLGHYFEKTPILNKALRWQQMPKLPKYPKKLSQVLRPPVYGLEMFRVLSRSKIGFNIHIDVAGKSAANIRLFEVTGVGSCLLTDHKDNLKEYFEIDKEVVTYRSLPECVEKVKWLLDHPKEREAIALAGQTRCLKDHNFEVRSQQLDSVIRAQLHV